MKVLIVLVLLAIAAIGCTDAQIAQRDALGHPAAIVCYSGGHEVYRGRATGKIETEERSDGWYFREDETGDLIRVSGDCVIRNVTTKSDVRTIVVTATALPLERRATEVADERAHRSP